jgi:dimethylargininase
MNQRKIALVRNVSSSINECELTHRVREHINVELARKQHHDYERALISLGCQIIRLPEMPNLPDAVFVEDTAIVLDEIAIVTRPGVISRRNETASVSKILAHYRQIASIKTPGTLEGGDVLVMGSKIYAGVSLRSNLEGINQLANILSPFDYTVCPVPVKGCLHLKSAVTRISEDSVLINPDRVDPRIFSAYMQIYMDDTEPDAANVVSVGNKLVYPSAYPKTLERLRNLGNLVIPVDISELIKAEGAVTCCSIIFIGDIF